MSPRHGTESTHGSIIDVYGTKHMCLGLFSSSSVSFIFLVMEGRGGGWWWWWYTSHNSRQIDNESLSDDRGNIGAMTYWRTKHRHTYIHTKRKQTRENLSDCGKIMAMEYTHNSTRLKRTNERTYDEGTIWLVRIDWTNGMATIVIVRMADFKGLIHYRRHETPLYVA